MSTITLLVRKDLRRFGPLSAAWMLLYFIQLMWLQAYGQTPFRTLPIAAVWGAWAFFIAPIIHDSPSFGSTEFWMTRPISGRQLFAAKLTVIVIFCACAPVVVLSLAKITGFSSSPWLADNKVDLGIIMAFPRLMAIALFFMLLASLTRSKLQYVGTLFCFSILIPIVAAMPLTRTGSGKTVRVLKYLDIYEWTAILVSITCLLWIIYNQYTRKNRSATICTGGLLVTALYIIRHVWTEIPKN